MQASLERLRRRREELGDEGGFTLIELLIVIVILGILAAIVVFAVQNLSSTSAQTSCKTDFKSVESAMETYKAQMGNYPFGGQGVAGIDITKTSPQSIGGKLYTNIGKSTDNAAGTLGTSTVVGTALLAGNYDHTTTGNNFDANNNQTVDLASPSGSAIGPWLKDVPANGKHYTIFAANDGTGTISVQNGNGTVVGGGTAGAVTNTATDCNAIS